MSSKSLIRRLGTAVACAALLGVAACASPSRPELMTVVGAPELAASPGDVGYKSVTSVTVSGGQETNPLWTAEVSNGAFKSALESSLRAAGYMGSEGQPMTVNASLVDLKQPMVGLDMTVTSRVRYSVERGGAVIFDETIAASGTATMGEALVGVERARMANEKSIKENIRMFLERFRAEAR